MVKSVRVNFTLLLFSFIISGAFLTPVAAQSNFAALQWAIDHAGGSWTAGENSVSKLSFEDQKRLCSGIIPDPLPNYAVADIVAPRETPPPSLDWRDRYGANWVTSVKNQGGCGSCAAFSSIGTFEIVIRIALGQPDYPIDLSEQHIFSCGGGDCSEGWYIGDALNYLKSDGAPDEACFPYSASDYNCEDTCEDWVERTTKINNWTYVCMTVPDTEVIKATLLECPVTTYLEVYQDFFSYESGVYEHVWGTFAGGHFVVIVGYDDTLDCWICKNSWDKDWGEEGYFRIRRGQTMIGSYAAKLTYIPPPTATPTEIPTLTQTPSATATQEPDPTHSPTPTPSWTASPFPTPIPSASATSTSAPTWTPDRTASPSPTGTQTVTPSQTPAQETNTPIPSETPPPTATDAPVESGVYCHLNQSAFTGQDPFRLSADICNGESEMVLVRMLIVLDAFGSYYFWPDWTQDIAWDYRSIGARYCAKDETILAFDWPQNAGQAEGVRFYAALVNQDSWNLFGALSQCEFSFY